MKLKSNGREVVPKKTKTINDIKYFLDDYIWRSEFEFEFDEITPKLKYDLNGDSKVDNKDFSLAGKTLKKAHGKTKSKKVPNTSRTDRVSADSDSE